MKKLLVLSLLIILTGAGCVKQTGPSSTNQSNSTNAPNTQKVPDTGLDKDAYYAPIFQRQLIDPKLKVVEKEIVVSGENNSVKPYKLEIKYPELFGFDNAVAEQRLNKAIKKNIDSNISDFKKSITDFSKDELTAVSEEDINYHIYLATEDVVSVQLRISINYTGHSMNGDIPFNYSVKTGKEIKIGDLFKNKNLSNLTSAAVKETLRVYNKDGDVNNASELEKYFGPVYDPSWKKFEDFVITKEGLVFYHWPSDTGPIVIALPWGDLRDIFDNQNVINSINNTLSAQVLQKLGVTGKDTSVLRNIATSGPTVIKVYFTWSADPTNLEDCSQTKWVERTVSKTDNLAQAALQQLILGPTAQEKKDGFKDFWINKKLSNYFKRVFIKDDTAYIDWGDITKVAGNASTSCGQGSFYAPVYDTLKQFPEIKNIVQAIDGRVELFDDFMQKGGCAANAPCGDEHYILLDQKYL